MRCELGRVSVEVPLQIRVEEPTPATFSSSTPTVASKRTFEATKEPGMEARTAWAVCSTRMQNVEAE
jgi:hypothetical protein